MYTKFKGHQIKLIHKSYHPSHGGCKWGPTQPLEMQVPVQKWSYHCWGMGHFTVASNSMVQKEIKMGRNLKRRLNAFFCAQSFQVTSRVISHVSLFVRLQAVSTLHPAVNTRAHRLVRPMGILSHQQWGPDIN